MFKLIMKNLLLFLILFLFIVPAYSQTTDLAVSTSNMLQHNRAKELLAFMVNSEQRNMKEDTVVDSTLILIRKQISELESLSEENEKKLLDPEVQKNKFLVTLYSILSSASILTSQVFDKILQNGETFKLSQKQNKEIIIMIKGELQNMISKYTEK